MYSGSDLDTLMTALNTLTSDNFFQYSFNVGQINSSLTITISNTWINSFPAIAQLAVTAPLLNVYFTTDFTPAVATFISNMQAACQSYADTNYSVWNAFYTHSQTFSAFLTALASKE
jgi:hypothetical protein